MNLRIVTTGLAIFGLVMLLAMPFVMGRPPAIDAAQRVKAEYLLRSASYVIVLMLVWVAVASCALILMRQIRTEMRLTAQRNLQELVEGTLRDHDKRKTNDQDA